MPPPLSDTASLLATQLPRTAAWLQQTALHVLPAMDQFLSVAGIPLPEHDTPSNPAGPSSMGISAEQLPTLRSGLRSTPGASASGGEAHPGALPLLVPVGLRSWRGLVRAGVVALVTGEVAAVGPDLAETLVLDLERLHGAQNLFQQLVVITAGMCGVCGVGCGGGGG